MTAYNWIVNKYRQMLASDPDLHTKVSSWLIQHSTSTAAHRVYDTEVGRLAYCVSHFAVGASTVENVLRTQATRRPYPHPYTFFRDELNLVSLGSGPGADLVGCLAALGAVPRKLHLYAADKESGWDSWAKSTVQATITSDPLLAAASPSIDFDQLDLNDDRSVREYLGRFQYAGPTVFVMHRVLGTVTSPSDLSLALASELLPNEAMVIAITPRRDGRHLSYLTSTLAQAQTQDRRGWVTRHDCGLIGHHGWTIPSDIWNALSHKPEVRAEYDVVVAMRDVVTTLRWPEIALDSRLNPQTSTKP